ncbi:MAG: alpha/beta hydrolase [Pseudomonadota bacterium]
MSEHGDIGGDTDVRANARVSSENVAALKASFEPLAVTVQDGIVLRGRLFRGGPSAKERRPVVCLAGLTRNGRDFDAVAQALSSGAQPRDVYTFDMRGRGLSDNARDYTSYTIMREMSDTADLMTAFGLFDCAVIGTSRGGLISMGLMAMQPTRIGALVLNDIGPVIEMDGLLRIGGYVGKTPVPISWDDARAIIKAPNVRDFPNLTDDDWDVLARQWYNVDESGLPAPGYDPDIAKTFDVPAGGFPELWPQFEAVTPIPVLTIRGENSDLLSAESVDRMARRHPRFRSHTVPGEGHAPLLRDEPTINAIRRFFDDAEPKEGAQ